MRFESAFRYAIAAIGILSAVAALGFLVAGEWRRAFSEGADAALYFLIWNYMGMAITAFGRGVDQGYREGLIASRAGKGWVE